MTNLLSFLAANSEGIWLLVLIVLTFILAVHWLTWIFAKGRFENRAEPDQGGIRFVLADLAVKIIDDFRHLLALLIVVIFFLALLYSLVSTGGDTDKITEVLQAVTSTLGGLIGAIIGYYFGESAARKVAEAVDDDDEADDEELEELEEMDDIEAVADPADRDK